MRDDQVCPTESRTGRSIRTQKINAQFAAIKFFWTIANPPADPRRFDSSGAQSHRRASQDTLDCRWIGAPECILRAGCASDGHEETAQGRVSPPANSSSHATNDTARQRAIPRNLPLLRSTRYHQ